MKRYKGYTKVVAVTRQLVTVYDGTGGPVITNTKVFNRSEPVCNIVDWGISKGSINQLILTVDEGSIIKENN